MGKKTKAEIRLLEKIAEVWGKPSKCETKGHVPSGETGAICYFRGCVSVLDICNECGITYQRPPTQKEYQDFMDSMSNPMTI